MCLIISIGIHFPYSVVQRSVTLIAPNDLDRPMGRILASRLAFSTYCSALMMADIVDIPSFYPNWLFLVSMCAILVNFLVISPEHILYTIRVMHIGL